MDIVQDFAERGQGVIGGRVGLEDDQRGLNGRGAL